ncbi:MAG: deoxyribonuclease IV [Candidatus Pristimantibacillus sp.]
MRIGRHLSIRGGYAEAARTALAEGISCFQYFPKNPRSLVPKRFSLLDAGKCAEICKQHDIVSVAHSPYPTQLATVEDAARLRVVDSLLNDLDIAEACGSIGVVVHFGIYKGPEILTGYQSIIRTLDEVTSRWSGSAKLLIEIQAGEHTRMGTTFEELAQIRKLCANSDQLAYCLDTCHMFASGMWNGEANLEWADKAKQLGILDHVSAIHFNDSLYPGGAARDRHAVLGKGYIGAEGMKWLMSLPQLREVPFLLETPPDEDSTYVQQLNLMREWGSHS